MILEEALQQHALVMDNVAEIMIKVEGLKAENQDRLQKRLSVAYTEKEFLKLSTELIGYDSIIKMFR